MLEVQVAKAKQNGSSMLTRMLQQLTKALSEAADTISKVDFKRIMRLIPGASPGHTLYKLLQTLMG